MEVYQNNHDSKTEKIKTWSAFIQPHKLISEHRETIRETFTEERLLSQPYYMNLKSYLADHYFAVKHEETLSTPHKLNSGIP